MFKSEKGAQCPQCERGKLKKIKRDLEFDYKGGHKIFKQEKVFKCNICGCEFLEPDDSDRISKGLTKFRRSIDKKIARIRLILKDVLGYMIDVTGDYDGYDVNNPKELKELIDKMVRYAKRKLKESEEL